MTPRRPTHRTRKAGPKATQTDALKVRFRGQDDAPLSIAQLQQGIYDLARKLAPYGADYRAKRATLYLSIVDRDGCEVSLSATGEWSIWPYRSAADELDASDARVAALTPDVPGANA